MIRQDTTLNRKFHEVQVNHLHHTLTTHKIMMTFLCLAPKHRYTCILSCLSGEMWVKEDTDFETMFASAEKGRCVSCPLGKSSKVGSWECQDLPSGQFGEGSICLPNTYSEGGAVKCTKCSWGTYSDTGASQCINCPFMWQISEHCDVPVAGILLTFSLLIIAVVASLLFLRYKKKQDRIIEKLRVDLYHQRQLVKTKQTDIKLMTGTTISLFSKFTISRFFTLNE